MNQADIASDTTARTPLYECNIPLRWGDQDAMGHVNNLVFYRLQEEVRIQWFNKVNIVVNAQGQGPIQAHGSCDFLKPIHYPGQATVRLYCNRVGNSSADFQIDIFIGATRVARGVNVLVWFDYQAGKPTPWPEAVRQLMLANVR